MQKVQNGNVYSTGMVTYETVNNSYLRQRKLKAGATAVLLWAFGVGSVIPGDYYGWNYGLEAGFWGLGLATLVMAIMYFCMVYSMAELSTALPHAGSLFSFTRNAFGPFLGFICGILVAIEYILATAALVVTLASYLKLLIPGIPPFLAWVLIYTVFVALVIYSMEITWYASLLLTLLSIGVLAIFYGTIVASGTFNLDLLFNIPPDPGQAGWLPKGWQGVFTAVPYAIWFYLAIEILPLAGEETKNEGKNMPKGLISAMWTLFILSILTLVLNTGVGGGAAALAKSDIPLADGLEAFAAGSSRTALMPLGLLFGLAAGAHTQMYGYGRILFALSRAGYIPRWLSVTSKKYTPYRALLVGTVIGFGCILLTNIGSTELSAVILNMAVFAALLTYILVMFSYIKLKITNPDLPRPYKSPLGIPGAIIAAVLAILALIACLSTPTYRFGFWGILVALVVAMVYFFLVSRNQLVAQAPEEAAALRSQPR
ncbi:MAG: amino acid permease [Kovacikia sp.]